MAKFISLGQPKLKKSSSQIKVFLNEIPQGISETDLFIFSRDGDNVDCYSRRCDHNRGRLTLSGSKGLCPLHGWRFDPEKGVYDDVQVEKKKELIEIDLKSQILLINQEFLRPEFPVNKPKDSHLTVSFLEHACLLVSTKQFKFAMDPWIIGPSFISGWWTIHPPVKDWVDKLNNCDFIYISHNHPDHLNPTTLSYVRKDIPMVVPDFDTKSVEEMLENQGFTNIIPLKCGMIYQLYDTSLVLSILDSGDFRDDSGIYFNYGDFSFLSTVDANDMNLGILPISPTVLATSFAGGASGFPLCFDTFDEKTKKKILRRNKLAIHRTQIDIVKELRPKNYLPYAGFFKERSIMDAYILNNNVKNSVKDYSKFIECKVFDVDESDQMIFNGNMLEASRKLLREDKLDDPEMWISSNLDTLPDLTHHQIIEYLQKSNFKDNLTLFLAPCNQDFEVKGSCYLCDFSGNEPRLQVLSELPDLDSLINLYGKANNILVVKVRSKALSMVLYNGLPWEDLSIGFQCRVNRYPNVYNSNFWYHFTNVYIGRKSRVAVNP